MVQYTYKLLSKQNKENKGEDTKLHITATAEAAKLDNYG